MRLYCTNSLVFKATVCRYGSRTHVNIIILKPFTPQEKAVGKELKSLEADPNYYSYLLDIHGFDTVMGRVYIYTYYQD